MSNRYTKPSSLKPPAICRKTPPWPAPTRFPHGLLLLSYAYEVWDDGGHQIKNIGQLILTPIEEPEQEWQSEISPDQRTIPGAYLHHETDAPTLEIGIGWEPIEGWPIASQDLEYPVPAAPPFTVDAILPSAPLPPYTIIQVHVWVVPL